MKRTHLTLMLWGCTLVAAGSQSSQAAPSAKCANITNSSCQPPEPRGVRLKISGTFNITNSNDGTNSKEVQVYGTMKFNGQQVWEISRGNAFTTRKHERVGAGETYLDVIYNDPSTWMLRIDGFLYDRDETSSDDALWNPHKIPHVVNIKQTFERLKARRGDGGGLRLAGDRESESADLFFIISKDSDIF